MDDLAACEDFAITVVEAHIVSAAMVVFDMKTADDRPCEKFFPTGCEKLDTVQRKKIFMLAIDELVKNYVNISVPQLPPESNADMSKVVTEYTMLDVSALYPSVLDKVAPNQQEEKQQDEEGEN